MLPLVLLVSTPSVMLMEVPARRSTVPLPVTVILAFCTMFAPAFTLMLPALLLNKAPMVMSLVAPPACINTLPAALTAPLDSVSMLPAVVTSTRFPVVPRLLCAASAACATATPLTPTRLKATAAVCPTVTAVASVRYKPPAPLSALTLPTSVSRWLPPAPTPPAVALALRRSSEAMMLISVSSMPTTRASASVILPAVAVRLILPSVLRSPTVMLLAAIARIEPVPLAIRLSAAWMMLPVPARRSTVPASATRMSANAVRVTLWPARILT